MNAKNKPQPIVPIDILGKYGKCMEEIKMRAAFVDEILHGKGRAKYHHITTVESIALQIRKILELIALATLVANKSEYEKYRKTFQSDWKAKAILKTLEKANRKFYPVPWTEKPNPEAAIRKLKAVIPNLKMAKRMKVRITSGYLSRQDYEYLYDKCSDILHASNPFSDGHDEKIQSFLIDAPDWMKKIKVLLGMHEIHLANGKVALWVIMQKTTDGKVQVAEATKVRGGYYISRGEL